MTFAAGPLDDGLTDTPRTEQNRLDAHGRARRCRRRNRGYLHAKVHGRHGVASRIAGIAAVVMCCAALATGCTASKSGDVAAPVQSPPKTSVPAVPNVHCTTSAKVCAAKAESQFGPHLNLVLTGMRGVRFVRLTTSSFGINLDYEIRSDPLNVGFEPGDRQSILSNPTSVLVRGVHGQFGEGGSQPTSVSQPTLVWRTSTGTWFLTCPRGTSKRVAIRIADSLS